MKKKSIYSTIVILMFVYFCCIRLQADSPKYKITSLPRLGETFVATSLNDLGEVVGYYTNVQGTTLTAFLYFSSNDTIASLGTLGGNSSVAYDINNKSQVVGWANTADQEIHAFLYSDQKMIDLDTLIGGKGQSQAHAINNAGQIVGSSSIDNSSNQEDAALFWQGKIISLGTFDNPYGSSSANDINDNYDSTQLGKIAGQTTYLKNDYNNQAFLYEDGKMTDISYGICSSFGYATAINNVGQMTINCEGNSYFSFIYDSRNGNKTLIGYELTDINDAGYVVGTSMQNNYNLFPLLFMDGTQYNLYNLIPTDPTLIELTPISINNLNQIVANIGNGEGIVLLTPVKED